MEEKGKDMKEEIKVAAKWWADQLRSNPKHDNGDALHNVMFAILANHLTPLSNEQVEKFEQELISRLEKTDHLYHIGVDYGADLRLRESCEAAGIDCENRFPVKSSMWFEPGKVSVSRGYRAPIEVIYEEPNNTEFFEV